MLPVKVVVETKTKAAHINTGAGKISRRNLVILIALFIVLIGVVTGLLVVQQPQNIKPEAAGGACPAEALTCSWSREAGVSYEYTIFDITNGSLPVKQGSVPASNETGQVNIYHQPEPNHTYRCAVTASNGCSAEGQASCQVTEAPPTSPPPATETPTAAPTEEIQPIDQGVSTSPSPTASPSGRLTPTDIIVVHATNTPTPQIKTGGTGGSNITVATKTPTPTTSTNKVVSPTTSSSSSSSKTTITPRATITLPATGIAELSVVILLFGVLIIAVGLVL